MAQAYQSTRSSHYGHFEDEAPLELCYFLLSLNAGIWASNVWGWLWNGLISLMISAFVLLAIALLKRTKFAS